MPLSHELVELARELSRPFRVEGGKGFRLARHDPGETLHLDASDKERARQGLERGVEALAALQDMLYAQNRWSVLLVFQAMDAAGKDSAIKHVLSGVNPQGCQVTSFKAPSTEELDHDYLWRCMKALPERGRLGIFNRSYYEEVLVVKVHKDLLAKQHLPSALIRKSIWEERYEDIRHIERYLARNGTLVIKFFLNVSKAEQKKRFMERLDNPDKNWKFELGDVRERGHWDEYMEAYEESIRATATPQAPWYVVPADNKWFTRLVVAGAIIDGLAGLKLHYPRLDSAKRAELAVARTELERQNGKRRRSR
jgi:PPK2 family polyphosphate:nucleotide phosphotransferase